MIDHEILRFGRTQFGLRLKGCAFQSFGAVFFFVGLLLFPIGGEAEGTGNAANSGQQPNAASVLDRLKLPGVTVNLAERSVDVAAEVCLDEGSLELIVCTKGSKEHESILTVESKPMHIHTALLLLGAKPGSPAVSKRVEEGEDQHWVDLAPRGGKVDVSLVFEETEGREVERPIHEFLKPTGRNPVAEKDADFPTDTFLFAGSLIQEAGDGSQVYLASRSGNVISIATFGDELLCLPEVYGHDNGALLWQVDDTHLPAVGSKVILRLRPQKKPDPSK